MPIREWQRAMPAEPTPRRSIGSNYNRLCGAWLLFKTGRVERLGATQFKVTSDRSVNYVDLSAEQTCYCRDMEFRGSAIDHQCKHTLAARIFATPDLALRQAIGVLVESVT
jgi:hypothetical protein